MSNELFYLIFTPVVIVLFGYAIYAERTFQKAKDKGQCLMVNKNSYVMGAYLATKNGNHYYNGYLMWVNKDEDCLVITDFGNIITMSLNSVKEHFEPSDSWIEAQNMGIPLPVLYDRIEEQIGLLERALDRLT